MIKFVEGQDQTNKLIKELSKTNYDAAIHWVNHDKAETANKRLNVTQSRDKSKPLKAIRNQEEPNPIDTLPFFMPNPNLPVTESYDEYSATCDFEELKNKSRRPKILSPVERNDSSMSTQDPKQRKNMKISDKFSQSVKINSMEQFSEKQLMSPVKLSKHRES